MNSGFSHILRTIGPFHARHARRLVLPLIVGAIALGAHPSFADTTWILGTAGTTATTAVTGGGTGNWNVAANWNSGLPDTGPQNCFVNNGGTVLITSSQSSFDCNSGTLVNGRGTYTMTGAGTTLSVNSWFRHGTANGAIGTFNLNGGTVNTSTTQGGSNINIGETAGASGVLNVAGGTFNANNTAVFQTGFNGTGNTNISSGTFFNKSSAAASLGTNATGVGTMTISGTGAYTGTPALNIGQLGRGTLNLQTGGTFTNAGNVVLGSAGGGNGTLNVSGGAMNCNAAGAGSLAIANPATGTSTATMTQTGGTVAVAGELWIGNTAGSTGTYNLSAGTATVGSWIALARLSSTGTLNISGPSTGATPTRLTKTTNTGNFTFSGLGGTQTGTLNQSGGIVTNTASETWLSETGTGIYNMSGGIANFGIVRFGHAGGAGTLNLQNNVGATGPLTNGGGAELFTATSIQLGETGANAHTINLNGGTLSTGQIFSGTGTGTRNFNFNGGTLQASAASATFLQGLSNAFVRAGGAVIDTQANNITIGQALVTDATSLGGGLTKNGSATLTLAGNNTYTGPTVINGGTLQLGTATTTGLLGGGTYSNVISGSGSLVKAGTGAQILRGANTYTGSTAFNLGTVTLDHSGSNLGSLGDTATTVASGVTLFVRGTTNVGTTAASSLAIGNTGVLDLRDSAINTLSIGGNFSTDNSALNFDIGSGNAVNDQISVLNGTATNTGTTTINLRALTSVTSGNYVLINAPAGGLTAGGAGFAIGSTPPGFSSYTLSNSTATQLILTITSNPSPATAYWTGAASANVTAPDANNNWGYGATLATPQSNWSSNKAGTIDTLQVPGETTDTFFVADNATSNAGALNTQLDGAYAVKSLTFDTSAVTSISSVGINTNGNSLTFGPGGLQVAAANTSSTTINGAGTVVLNGNQNWANNSISNALNVTPGISGFVGATTLNLNGTGAGGVVLGGAISNGTSTSLGLTFNQAGVTQVNGANTYTGGTTINSGTVQTSNAASLGTLPSAALAFGANSTGILQLNGTNLSLSDLSTDATVGTPVVQNNGTASSTLTVNTANTNTYAGLLQNGGAGTLALTKAGAGKLTLSGANTYTGGTTITAGTVNVASAQNGTTSGPLGASGTITFGNSILQYSPANQFDYSPRFATTGNQTVGIDTNGQDVSYASNLILGTGVLSKLGGGNLTLNGPASTMGSLFGRTGTLTLATGSAVTTTGYSSIGLLNGDSSTVAVNGTANLTVGNDLNIADTTGSVGVLNMNGTGAVKGVTIYVGKSGNANGTVNQTSGTVQQTGGGDVRIGGSGSVADASAVGVYNLSGGTLTLVGNTQIGGYGKGTVNQTGGTATVTTGFPSIGRFPGGLGIWNLTGGTFSQTGTGSRVIVGEAGTGTFNVGDGTNAGSGTLNTVGGITLGLNAGSSGLVNLNKGGLISTKFVQLGAGTAASNVFNFNGGVLQANIATGATFMTGVTSNVGAGGAIIDTNNFANTIATNLVGSVGDGGLTKNGAGVLSITGANTYTGGNTINGGTLSGTTSSIVGNTLANANTVLDFNQTANGTYANIVSGDGGLSKNGTGAVTLSGTNTFTGGVNVNFGSLVATSNSSLGTGTKTITISNGTAGNSQLHLNGSTGSINLPATFTYSTSNAAGAIFNDAGNNSISGQINMTNGGGATTLQSDAGNLDVSANLTTIATGRALNVQGAANGSISGIISDGLSVPLPVNKNGTGTWTLSGANTYTGTTTVTAGTLLVNNITGSGTGTGAVSVATGGTLGGTGTMSGAVNIASGGTHAPGVSGPGLQATGSYSNSGLLAADVSGTGVGTGYDQVAVTGTVSLGGSLNVIVPSAYTPVSGDTFILISNDGTDAVSGTFTGLAQGASVNSADGRVSFTVSYVGGDGNDVTLTVSSSRASVLISELRFSGPGGALDEFIELANTTAFPVSLSGWTLTAGTTTTALSSIDFTGKTIPAKGHLLLTNSGGYSLTSVATGDVPYTGDIAPASTLTLSNAASTVVDTVGNLSAIAAPSASTNQYAYVRRLDSGVAADSGSDSADFNLVDTSATISTTDASGVGPMTAARLGAPGPQNIASPIARNGSVELAPLTIGTVQPTARYVSRGSTIDTKGRMGLRRTLKNNTGGTVTTLRFRIVGGTTGTSSTASGVADLRAISSAGVRYYASDGTTILQATVPVTLDAPSSPTEAPLTATSGNNGKGGGMNSSWTVALPSGGLAPGASVGVEFLFGIVADGNYRIVLDAELLP